MPINWRAQGNTPHSIAADDQILDRLEQDPLYADVQLDALSDGFMFGTTVSAGAAAVVGGAAFAVSRSGSTAMNVGGAAMGVGVLLVAALTIQDWIHDQ
jgi:hypothetical protein